MQQQSEQWSYGRKRWNTANNKRLFNIILVAALEGGQHVHVAVALRAPQFIWDSPQFMWELESTTRVGNCMKLLIMLPKSWVKPFFLSMLLPHVLILHQGLQTSYSMRIDHNVRAFCQNNPSILLVIANKHLDLLHTWTDSKNVRGSQIYIKVDWIWTKHY